MTCVGSGFTVRGLFLWIIKWNNENVGFQMLGILARDPQSLSLVYAVQQININGPSHCLCLGHFTSNLNHVQSTKRKQDCREGAGAALRSRPLELPLL